MDAHQISRQARTKNAVFGGMLIAGGLWLVFGGRDIWYLGTLWPLLIVGLGVSKILGACCRAQQRDGAWVLALGLWFVLNEFTNLRYHDTWPLLLVAFGTLVTWQAVSPAERCVTCTEGDHD
jgi:hypothetical protein